MIIATRSLILRGDARDTEIPIRLYMPEQKDAQWICRFDIGWPEGKAERRGTGGDAIEAIVHALQMIGSEIYTSDYHEAGTLSWLLAGAGYGFPLPNSIRDLLVGDDAKYL